MNVNRNERGSESLQVFLCHASADKPAVRQLHERLKADGFKPWLDEVDIPGGVRWEDAIEDAVRESDVVVIALTRESVSKEGYLQRESRFFLSIAEEKPDDVIFIIPLKLEECKIPRKLKEWQYINYFHENGYARVLDSLFRRAKQLGILVSQPLRPSSSHDEGAQDGRQVDTYGHASHAAEFVLQQTSLQPAIGITTGLGMAPTADKLVDAISISWNDIPHFPPSRRANLGRFAIGRLSGIPVVVVQGRIMLYERGRLQDVVFPIRVLGRLGVRSLILTGAAASVNPAFAPGNLVALSDHINTMGANALVGLQDPRFGPDFIDLSEVYSKHYRKLAIDTARELGFEVREGVYAEHSGPAYETPAETRSLRSQGSDLVGASIVPEAIATCHTGLELLAICAVTNYATGLITDPSSAEEIVATGIQLQNRLAALINAVVPKIASAQAGNGQEVSA